MYSMRQQLIATWGRWSASAGQLLKQLQDWCQRAEASGIRPLAEFSQRLRSHAEAQVVPGVERSRDYETVATARLPSRRGK